MLSYNLGLDMWNGFRFEVTINGNNTQNYRLTAQSSVNSYPGYDWHYVVGTYSAETGEASIYVDNVLVRTVDLASIWTGADSWTRAQRDIKWTNNDQTAATRLGEG